MQMMRSLLAAAALLASMTGAQARDLVVVESTAPDLPAGRVVNGSAPLSLKAGTRVTLIGDDGKVIKLDGPFNGAVGNSAKSGDPAVVAAISRLFEGQTAENTSLGTFRGGSHSVKGDAVPADALAIDIRRPGTQCVAAGTGPTLWRADAGREATVALQQLPGGPGGLVRFPTSAETAAWPVSVPIADNVEYLVRDASDAWSNTLRLRLLPASAADGLHRVVWMADNGCTGQARALLATLL